MANRLLIVVNPKGIANDSQCQKLLDEKLLLPLGTDLGKYGNSGNVSLKLRHPDTGKVAVCPSTIARAKDQNCLRFPPEIAKAVINRFRTSQFAFLYLEGPSTQVTATLCFVDSAQRTFESLEAHNPALRLIAFDLPPIKQVCVDSPQVLPAIHSFLAHSDEELFSVQARLFLNTPHVLTQLFSHVMSLESTDHINFISILRVIADEMRGILKPRIRQIPKDHHKLWGRFYGERISFVDGGLSRIVSLPGTEPMGIRVGVYSVIPGETNLDIREDWGLDSFVIGDVLSDRNVFDDSSAHPDPKRMQEAARYILEPLVSLRYLERASSKPRAILLHGPLQNAFETYNECEPCFVPGVSPDILDEFGISEKEIELASGGVPSNLRNVKLWNVALPVYVAVMARIFASSAPILGVVERNRSSFFATTVIRTLNDEGAIPDSTARLLRTKIEKYDISDELLFGCILNEGEYLEPISMPKNFKRRAQDRWRVTVDHLPAPRATMLKCSSTNFPYRIELNGAGKSITESDLMDLLYHMSLLLPDYAFPVGIDIADKHAKIPDWLSKGISSTLTAAVLRRVLESGDTRTLAQVRRLLALSPRDYFFRPKA